MTCLDVFSDAAADKVSVSLNAKDHISPCKYGTLVKMTQH
jgi:hypothetical protein